MKNKTISKLIKKIQNNKLYFCTIVISIAIISILFKLNNTTPFGDRSLLCVDFYHQYGPMLGELYDRVHGNGNFIYSFNMAMGLPFFRNFLNYLSSPFNIIMLFFPRKGLLTSFSFIIGLKAVAASFTCVYYLSKKFKTKELYLMPLGIIYAFSAYYSAYYWNIMWIDGMVFLPLITLGIENIVNKNKWKTYSLFLAIMLISNYFIGYMICIYSVIYFLIYNIYKTKIFNIKINKKNKNEKREIKILDNNYKNSLKLFFKKCFIFGISSLLGGMLTFCLLLPMASSMASISATGGSIPTTQYYDFQLIDFIKGHLTGVHTTVFASDDITNPNVSCGMLSVALLLAYLLNLDIKLKNKVCYFLILGFFIAAFFIPQLDYIMQAFHVPNDLPYRYSFIYSFILVVIGAYSLINIKKIKFYIVAIGYVLLMTLLLYITNESWADISNNMIYINMILLTLYFIFYSGIYFLDNMHNIFYIALAIVACIDVVVSINYNWDISQDMNLFYSDYNATRELLDFVENYDDELFYRIENTNMMTLNDPSWYNYYGMTTFSSMAYENMAILQHNLGMPGNEINSYYYVQSTPIYDLMFDIKYFIGNSNDFERYTQTKTIEETANEFTYNVGLGFGVNDRIKEWDNTNSNPFIVQNDFIEKATDITNTLEKVELYHSEEIYNDNNKVVIKYEFTNTYDNLYYYSNDYSIDFMIVGDCLYYNNENYNDIVSNIDGLSYSYLDDYSEKKIININSGEQFVTIYVAYNNYYSMGFNLYAINQDNFEYAYNNFINYKLDITEFNESNITGNINLDDNMDIYTSIPYDEGWHAYLDGKEVNTYALADALLVIEGSPGQHTLTLKYKIPHLKLGFICTIISASIIILDILREKNIIKIKFKKKKTA